MNHRVEASADASPARPKDRRGETLRQRVMRYALLALVVYLIWCGTLYFSQDRLIFPGAFSSLARGGSPTPPAGVERVMLAMGDGVEGMAWFALGAGRAAESPGAAVVFFHGNHETVEGASLLISEYTRRGVSVLVPEYRGFGGAKGRPSERAIVADSVAWVEWLSAREDIDAARVVLHGRSLGSGVAAQVAAQVAARPGAARAPAALITESGFSSVASFAAGYGVPPILVRHPFRTDRVIGEFTFPILIMHGEQDSIIPVSHARRLGELQPKATVVIMEGDHNDFPRDFRLYVRTIMEFLERAGVMQEVKPPAETRTPSERP